jgi:hypothetical protein
MFWSRWTTPATKPHEDKEPRNGEDIHHDIVVVVVVVVVVVIVIAVIVVVESVGW